MNALHLARTAYSGRDTPTRNERAVEYDLFARVTQRLRSAHQRGKEGFPQMVSALYDNRRFWTLLATNVADSDNALPQQLRAQLFYLAEFTEHHSQKVLEGAASATALIEINTAVMRGLRQERTPS